MTSTTTETAAPSTSRRHPAGENLISYRSAREFRDSTKRGVDDEPQKQWLRVFTDGHDVLRAGLYDTPQPDLDDHWANGETLTDETDAAMISTCLAGAGTETMKTALLGIAYARISDVRPRPLTSGCPNGSSRGRCESPTSSEGRHQVRDGRLQRRREGDRGRARGQENDAQGQNDMPSVEDRPRKRPPVTGNVHEWRRQPPEAREGPGGAKPYIKWPGGKRQMLPALRPFYPAEFTAYHEPFLGAGAVLIDLMNAESLEGRTATGSDINGDLVGTWTHVRDRTDETVDELRALVDIQHSTNDPTGHFYLIRQKFNTARMRIAGPGWPVKAESYTRSSQRGSST